MATAKVIHVSIPYEPRPQQAQLHHLLKDYRWVVAVCHRRMGKTVAAVNQLQKAALTCTKERPRFAYIAPTYRQGKDVAWSYMKHYARPIPDHAVNESELRIDYPNGGRVRIYGADNPDSLRGIYLDGVFLDEYGLMSGELWGEVVRPLLTDREGWACFMGTPNGKNQFWQIAQTAQRELGWRYVEYRASQTHLIPAAELAQARAAMTEDEYAQEFECSWEASVKGAVFARELTQARDEGRVCHVPYDPALPVDTDWDLGVGDHTAVWFSQTTPAGAVHVIDYLQDSGAGLAHYVKRLRDKPYAYGTHWAPHDIEVRELGTGHSRLESARGLGLYFRVVARRSLEDGIHAARMLFPKCWFDAARCQVGLEALSGYRWDFNARIKEFTARPVHDRFSHGADAFRGLATRCQVPALRRVVEVRGARDVDPDDPPSRRRRVSGNPFVPVRP